MTPTEHIHALKLSHAELRGALLLVGRDIARRKIHTRPQKELLKILRRVIRESRAVCRCSSEE